MPKWTTRFALGCVGWSKRSAPIVIDGAAGILARLGLFAEVAEHRINVTLHGTVAAANRFLHASPFTIMPQSFELLMRIKNQGRARKPTCAARATGVQPDDIQGFSGEAKGEPRIGRVRSDRRIPRVPLRIYFMQLTQLRPEKLLEIFFTQVPWFSENRHIGGISVTERTLRMDESAQVLSQEFRRLFRSQLVIDRNNLRASIEGGLGSHTGKGWALHRGGESCFKSTFLGDFLCAINS